MVINEVYIGRIPEIDAMCKEFSELRSSYAVWKVAKNNKRMAKLEKMIEDFFGFTAFALDIDPNSTPNAYTYAVSSSIDIDPWDYIETTSKGYRFKKGSGLASMSCITAGLFTNNTFTDEEVFAIFLHEIGHSFTHRSPMIQSQQDVYKMALIIQIITDIILGILYANPNMISQALGSALGSTNFFKRVIAEFNKAIKKIPILRETKVTADTLSGLVMNVFRNFVNTIVIITGTAYIMNWYSKFEYDMVTKKQIKITGNPAAYQRSAERLSDDFATMYGFGPQLASGLVKLGNPNNQGWYMSMVHKIPVVQLIFKKTFALSTELLGAMGAHPGNADRLLNIVDGMEMDLKKDKDLPPKIKKELAANIAKTKTVIKKIKSDQANELTNSNEYLQALTVLQLNKGNSEDFLEKRYTDRAALKKFYDERKIRKESALEEVAILTEFDII